MVIPNSEKTSTLPSGPARDTASGILRRAEAALAASDGALALRHYSALLRQLPEPVHRCGHYVGALAATLLVAPWGDERALMALDAFGEYARKHPSDPKLATCKAQVSKEAAPLATQPHKDALNMAANWLYVTAIARYRRFLSALLDENQMRYWMAEALYKLAKLEQEDKRLCEVVPIFLEVTRREPLAKYASTAAYTAVLSWMDCHQFPEPALPDSDDPHRKKSAPSELSPAEREILEALDLNIRYVPQSPKIAWVYLIKATLLRTHNQFEQAIATYRTLVRTQGDSPEALSAARQMLQLLPMLGLAAEVPTVLTEVCATLPPAHGERLRHPPA